MHRGTTTPVRVAHLLWRLSRGGGVQTVVRQLVSNADPEAADFHVVTARPWFDDDVMHDLRLTHYEAGVVFRDHVTFTSRVRCGLGMLRRLREIRPDVVQVHSGTAWMGFIPSIALFRTPFVLEVHDAPGSGRHGAWTDRIEGWWAKARRATVVCHSSSVESEIIRLWRIDPSRIAMFPLAVELEQFDQPTDPTATATVRAESGIDPASFLMVVVGRLVPSKRFDLAVDAAHRLVERGVDASLLVIGEGREKTAMVEQAERLGIADRVAFAGARFGDELADHLHAADVLISTSSYEGFGLTLVEAMGAGLPTVAMSVGGVTDIVVDGETGYLVGAGDLTALVDRVEELAKDREAATRMGTQGRERAETEFSAAAGAQRFVDLYRRVARGPAPTRRYDSRPLDLAILAVAAVPAGLLGLACAVAVKLTSSGPVLFRQERVGLGGEPFMVLKFRTMLNEPNPIFPDASRITSAGRFLRRFSLDELPQLINVARGEMSVVGPRPTLAYQVERYDERQRRRLDVRPGLTGLAQVSGRNALSWPDRIEIDVQYVERQSLRLDLSIIARTAKALLGGEGVEGHPTDDALAAVPDTPEAGTAGDAGRS
ncbi:MAG: sugar transferase [Acidimicrobiales bacterium]